MQSVSVAFRIDPVSPPENAYTVARKLHAEASSRLFNSVQELAILQEMAIVRSGVHKGVATSIQNSLYWWAFCEAGVLIVLGGLQIKFLKSCIETKQVV